MILDIELPGIIRFTLINLYACNNDNPLFFSEIKEITDKMENSQQIWTGDWNVPLTLNDTYNYKHIRNIKANREIHQIITDNQLIDIWREQKPKEKAIFLGDQKSLLESRARLLSYLRTNFESST